MIGDVPFYVGLDSADTWAHSELIRCAYASIADIAIIQMQDALQR